MSWYVIQTNPRAEATAAHWLDKAGYEVLFLQFWGTHSHAGRETKALQPLFPSYLFVALEPSQGFYRLCTTIGVRRTVGRDGPEEVPVGVIEELKERRGKDGYCILTPKEKELRKRLQKGTRVAYRPDPFTEYFGQVMLDCGPAMSAWINGRKVTAPSHHFSPVVAER